MGHRLSRIVTRTGRTGRGDGSRVCRASARIGAIGAIAQRPPREGFMLPGGTRFAAQTPVARNVGRRADRAVVARRL